MKKNGVPNQLASRKEAINTRKSGLISNQNKILLETYY